MLTGGRWDGSLPITFTYSWRRCDPQGTLPSCVAIPGATGTTYTPTVADIGFAIRVWIVGTNSAGSDTAITNHTYPVIDKPHFAPSATTPPSITGVSQIGLTLTASSGAFSGDLPITTNTSWWRCDATGAACHLISTARKLTYTPTAADVGFTLRFSVTAKNAYGTITLQSDPTEPVPAPAPRVRGKRIVAAPGRQFVIGTHGDDVIYGNRANDTIIGNGGYDMIYGGRGNDVITVNGPGTSHVFTGAGSNTVYAANGYKDVITCGAGDNRVVVDPFDVVKGCKMVVVKDETGATTSTTPTSTTPTSTTPTPGTKP
jgi:hypothetical protein